MTQVQSITDDASQEFTIQLPDGSQMQLSLWYVPLQLGWFMAVQWKTFQINCMRVTRNQNMLDQWSDLLTFGLGCFTDQGEEPLLQEDFAAGRAVLYVLDQTDVASLGAFYGA